MQDFQLSIALFRETRGSLGASADSASAYLDLLMQQTTVDPDHAAAYADQFLAAVESLESPALTKAQLAELLFEQIGLNKRESKEMIDAFFDLISVSLVDGQDVKISGFGNFQIRTKAPRPGRNPRTGEAIPIEARRVVTFHASQKLKEMVELASLPASVPAPQPLSLVV